ncbi:CDP-alcohol phosphatidyltransferase family protein [Candidatus Micrarchaeota archaeon]|nr:CDP-alcohol phosphatidyltransferase family protein [Candidatus Micrarchaeota archaeon]
MRSYKGKERIVHMLKSGGMSGGISSSLGKYLGWVPLSPNQITVLSVLCAVAGFALFYLGNYWYGFGAFILAFVLDAVDGAVARARGETSKIGGFLDGVSDRLVEFFLLLSLLFVPLGMPLLPDEVWIISVLFFGTCMTAFVKAYANYQGVLSKEEADNIPGVLERGERGALLMVFVFLALYGFAYAWVLFGIIAGLSLLTFVQRIVFVVK